MNINDKPLIDSHCHLDRLNLDGYSDGIEGVIARAEQQGVNRMLCVGIDAENSETCLEIATKYPQVVASVGIHPLSVKGKDDRFDLIEKMASSNRIVAIGETGLDFFYDKENHACQQESFVHHLELARKLQKPVIVHTRDARTETIELIKAHGCRDSAGVLHCFTEDIVMAKQALELNYYISISGIITFNNAEALRDVVKQLPLDRLLIETDSPYLAPVPHRGKPNEPQYVRLVAEYIAKLLDISTEELARKTTENFYRLFGRV
ncbi:TatD DNase family protein [Sinobacterium caligoides]|uniref:TatD DNase family protein n=1 Tax=Sinobacterium caligoides TaxID=933926 RepID=A0A3N2DJR9_9GAMM|nr:TatD family hydrolase [Sinobacterium caligoides]ROS00053.1 TatD DNase family protein [Sinobacterium caligoides]